MRNSNSPAPRLLFVIDDDYGALGLVMYMLFRQTSLARATLLLPKPAYDLHENQVSVASYPYESIQDILAVVESERPDVVFLVSGYSYAYRGLISIRDLRKLKRLLKRRHCKLSTSDPYLGTFRQIADAPTKISSFQQSLRRRCQRLPGVYAVLAGFIRYFQKRRLKIIVNEVADCLESATHFCPVPEQLLPGGKVNYVSFYNPLAILNQDELRSISANVSAFPDIGMHRPRWLFVLARFDLEFQQEEYGEQGFVDIVVSKIREAVDSGKHPTFIGPATFTSKVAEYFKRSSDVSLLSACPFDEFQFRLLDAEVAFYWQIFSTSTFLRLLNGLPVFFFDQGHTARISEPMHEAGLKCYYLAGSPTYLNIEKPLDARRLAELSARFRRSAHDSRQRLARTPTPEEMANSIINST